MSFKTQFSEKHIQRWQHSSKKLVFPGMGQPRQPFFFFWLFRVEPTAYGGSQPWGQIRVVAASLHRNPGQTKPLTH